MFVDVEHGQAHRREHADGAQAGVEDEVSEGEVIDVAEMVEEGVVQSGVAQGYDECEDGACHGYVAEILRCELSREDDGGDRVYDASGVGAPQGVSGAARDASESGSLGIRHHRSSPSAHLAGTVTTYHQFTSPDRRCISKHISETYGNYRAPVLEGFLPLWHH